MKLLKKIAALFAASALAVTFAGCNNSQESGDNGGSDNSGNAAFKTVDQIKENGEVTIGVFSDKNPFGYVDNTGKYQGYDVYFAERIAKDLGVELKLVPVEAASRVEFLETSKVDIILANFTVTDERKEKVDFALPYMKVALGVVSPDNAIIKSAEELNGKTLIVVKGYSALQDGRGDAFSTDNTEVLAWAKSNPGFTVGVETLGSTDAIAPAVTKGNETLLKWLNDEITALADEQFFHKDYDETLAAVYGDDEAYKENLVVEGGKM